MLASEISVACDARDGMAARIRSALERVAFDRHLLSAGQREACADCYARHVIYSDPLGRFTILAIVWGAGQFSTPHAHDTWCAYAVYENPLQETVYAIGPRALKAKPVCTKVRNPGYSCFAGAGLDQIHRLGNSGISAGGREKPVPQATQGTRPRTTICKDGAYSATTTSGRASATTRSHAMIIAAIACRSSKPR